LTKFLLIIFFIINIAVAKEYTIGYSQNSTKNDWMVAQAKELKNEVAKHDNLKLIVKQAESSVAKQVKDIEDFIKLGVDFIIATPLNAKIGSIVMKKALKKGIKVILISRSVEGNNYTAFVAPDNFRIGNDAAKFLAKHLNFKGTVLMLQGRKGSSSTTEREKGFDIGIREYKNIKIIKRRANYLRSDAMIVMENLYKEKIDFDAIYSHSDSMLIGARKVMERLNKPIVPSVGIDYIKQSKKAIQDGKQLATFVYHTSAKEGVELIVDTIKGKTIPKNSVIKTKLITKQNVNQEDPIF
jgi:ribose transport system substrate-binding protein